MTLNSWPTVYLSSCLMYMYLAQCHPLLYPKPCCKEVAGFCSMYSSWGLILKFSSGLLWWIYVNCFKAYILLIVNNSWLVLLPFVFSQVPLLNGEIIGKCLWFCPISTVEPLHNKTLGDRKIAVVERWQLWGGTCIGVIWLLFFVLFSQGWNILFFFLNANCT